MSKEAYSELSGLIVKANVSDVHRVLWRRDLDIPRRAQHAVDEVAEAGLPPAQREPAAPSSSSTTTTAAATTARRTALALCIVRIGW